MYLEFNTFIRKNIFEKEVVLGNEHTGFWVRVTKECYDLICNAVDQKYDEQKLCSKFEDADDKEYITELIKLLKKDGILKGDPEYKDNIEKKVTFSITSKCNLQCLHCSVSAGCNKQDYFTDSQIFEIADNILKYAPDTIIISGGEPLMRDNFFEISNYIRERFNGKLLLMTNATKIDEKEAVFIANNYDAVATSLDGYDEHTSDFIRGKGTFRRTCNAIRLLKDNGLKNVSVSMVLAGDNYDSIDRFRNLNKLLGTHPVFRILAPMGRADKNFEKLIKSEKSKFLIAQENVNKVRKGKKRVLGQFSVCSGITSQFCIGSDGNIYPCAGSQMEVFSLGNIWKIGDLKSFFESQIYKTSPGYKNFMSIKPSNHEKCGRCNLNIHCVYCPVYIYLYQRKGLLTEYCDKQGEKIKASYGYK